MTRYDNPVRPSSWLRFRPSLSMNWRRFWIWLDKDESTDQPASVRAALKHFQRENQDDGQDER